MNKIKISDSDKRLLIIFFAIVILACSYFFVFNKGMNKASELEDKNAQDRATVQQMEQMEAALPQVKENIQTMKQTQEEIIGKYPSDMKMEKVIETLQTIEKNSSDFHITDITFAMNMPVSGMVNAATTQDSTSESTDTTDAAAQSTEAADTSDTAGEVDSATDTTGTDSATTDATASDGSVGGYYASIGIRYEASYNGLKEMIAYVNQFKDRTTIDQFSASFDDSTGKLTGDMTLNMYYITNTGKDYVPPVFDFMPKGVSNIFGSTTGASQGDSGENN